MHQMIHNMQQRKRAEIHQVINGYIVTIYNGSEENEPNPYDKMMDRFEKIITKARNSEGEEWKSLLNDTEVNPMSVPYEQVFIFDNLSKVIEFIQTQFR